MLRHEAISKISHFLQLLLTFEARANRTADLEPVFSRIKWFGKARGEFLNPLINGKPVRLLKPERYGELENALSERSADSPGSLYFSESDMDQLLVAFEQYMEAWGVLDGRRHEINAATTHNMRSSIEVAKDALSASKLTPSDLNDPFAIRAFLDPMIFFERQRGNGIKAFNKGRAIYIAFTKWPHSLADQGLRIVNLRLNILIRIGYAAHQHNLPHQLSWVLREILNIRRDEPDYAGICDLILFQHEGYASSTSQAALNALVLETELENSPQPFFGYDSCKGGCLCNAGAAASGIGYDIDTKIDNALGLSPREMLVDAWRYDMDVRDHEGAALSSGALARALMRAKHEDEALYTIERGFNDLAKSGIIAPYATVSLLNTRSTIYRTLSKKSVSEQWEERAIRDVASAAVVASQHGLSHLVGH